MFGCCQRRKSQERQKEYITHRGVRADAEGSYKWTALQYTGAYGH